MIKLGTDDLYKAYKNMDNTCWRYGDSILYRMCKEEPRHTEKDVIVGKIWLIGRSYAAAIERRKNATVDDGDFYQDVVAPKMMEIGQELDERIARLRNSNGTIRYEVEQVLSTHKFLTDVFRELTQLDKRSLASKYLHFHCPEKFFIYDSRARAGIGKIVRNSNKNMLSKVADKDPEYGDFVCRMLELQEYIESKFGVCESPRELDRFLLKI